MTLTPTEDTFTTSQARTTNYGTSTTMRLGKATSGSLGFNRAYLKFDVARIPLPIAGLEIHKATLRLYQGSTGAVAGSMTVNAHRVTSAWSEKTLTWSTNPTHASRVYASAGVGNSSSRGRFIEWNVTALVAEWVFSLSKRNLGVALKDSREITAGTSRYGIMDSRESAIAGQRPQLVVTYTPIAVDLLALSAERGNDGVRVAWTTASEISCGAFDVLRCIGDRCGRGDHEAIARVDMSRQRARLTLHRGRSRGPARRCI